jgi:hypothetical protein
MAAARRAAQWATPWLTWHRSAGAPGAALAAELALIDAPSCVFCLSPMEQSGTAEHSDWSCPWCGAVTTE